VEDFIGPAPPIERPPFRLVHQRRGADCGVACVAMVAGTDYERALAAFLDFGCSGRWTDVQALRRALIRVGVRCGDRLIPATGKTPPEHLGDAIWRVNQIGRRWHWVVWDSQEQRILDPMRSPRKRYRVASRLPIRW
jgi:hypothetical protein